MSRGTDHIRLVDFKRQFKGRAKGRPARRVPGEMNKTERAFSELANTHKCAGLIQDWWFEAMTFKLGHDFRYTPDFMILEVDNTVSFIEVKGSYLHKSGVIRSTSRDDSAMKLKMSSNLFPFVFKLAVLLPDKSWDIKEVR